MSAKNTAVHPRSSDALVRRPPATSPTWAWEPSQRWLRGYLGDTAVVESRRAILVWEPGAKVPEYGFPLDDVRTDLLVPGDAPASDYYRPRLPARHWFDLVDGERRVPAAAWTWDLDELDGFIAVTWFPDVLDGWTEEDEPVFAHPRDPRNRVDALTSSRHVVVREGDRVLADSHAPVIVYETGLPPRYYLPRTDIVWSALRAISSWSECPYKGRATDYWASASGPDREIAWSYPAPLPVVAPIAGLVAFYSERVTVEVDGVIAGRVNVHDAS
ncbi:DUF427 domain-containing protein [Microbacterium trichothecenolyticum]|uniref:DUF427 domain-containing protein n=1 Tax=Microbacterium ureisolvens TaxID=2781186 RepID=A0ABS7HVU9_9MICO|nr:MULTISPECIES: DUF427 domain-containing protein [Microbacterium]MBW9108964.1 DUF427 domain-containing protein [Microbacterium ureisolvens]MBW9119912.1 DUF427 domain-containing protein [Microbacterium trichothecenolyticum]